MNKTSPWGRRMARLSSLLVLPIGLAMLALAVVYLGVQELSRARIQPASEVVTPEQFADAKNKADALRAELAGVKSRLEKFDEKLKDFKPSVPEGVIARLNAAEEKLTKADAVRADVETAKAATAMLKEWKTKAEKDIAAKADKGEKTGTGTAAMSKEQVAALAKVEKLDERVTKAEKTAADAKAAADVAAKGGLKAADVQAKIKEAEERQGKALTEATKEAVKPGDLKAIREKLEEIATGLSGEKVERKKLEDKLSALPRVEATDVAVLAMHSRTLGIHNYYDGTIQDFVDPKKATVPAGSRVGFYLAEGSDFEKIYPLAGGGEEEGARKMRRLDKARSGASARLVAAQVKSLRAELPDAKKGRCVLIGSTECGLDDAALALAKEVPTHVVLIGRDGDEGAAAEKGLSAWHRLSREQGLPLTILRCADPENPDDKTKAQLRAALVPATQPKLKTPRR